MTGKGLSVEWRRNLFVVGMGVIFGTLPIDHGIVGVVMRGVGSVLLAAALIREGN